MGGVGGKQTLLDQAEDELRMTIDRAGCCCCRQASHRGLHTIDWAGGHGPTRTKERNCDMLQPEATFDGRNDSCDISRGISVVVRKA